MRRRKASVVWLPLDVTNRVGTDDTDAEGTDPTWLILTQDVPAFTVPVVPTVTIQPLVKDEPQGVTAATSSLSDLEGSAYRLRRVVGKIFVLCRQTNSGDMPSQILTTVGLIVLRCDIAGNPIQGNPDTYDVAAMDSTRDPWIWRRSWGLGQNGQTDDVPAPDIMPLFPSSNIHSAASALDGPHIDAKTARLISDEERLFLVWSSIALDGNSAVQDPQQIILLADLRILATMRKQSGNRRNASR